jgi:2-phospho-L-lactate/phosphoenolpyruvate guanylyltransferase
MPAIVIPFRGQNGNRRLDPLTEDARHELALAMLGDVLAACVVVGPTVVVTGDEAGAALAEEIGGRAVPDPEEDGQAGAVAAGLAAVDVGPALVVNADLPCVVPHDLRVLAAAAPPGGIALVAADDGTTNALALSDPGLFAPVYGPRSAARFKECASDLGVDAVSAVIPSLAQDVDTLADLERVSLGAGPRTQTAIARLGIPA